MCLLCYIAQIQNMGNGHQQGGVLLGMSCYLGFEVYPFCNFYTETAETPSPVSSPRDATVRTSPPVFSVTGKIKIQNGNSFCSYWNSCSCCICAPVSYQLLPA
ncbi:uncharacterized protein LOC120253680 [Dioscorea cayenensis subsp. rotundata]|uniref:Uncharacterized protein LOC120253680 n=1 Tax=Dioscorea cayennensis subsp. rotundata TaxID=55577 RepID=A0AB40ASW2_DIOCR|nr:uncharacterized protein LOC120253680 [Dioscorea cayenensis subsp. rotundata]